MFDDDPVLVTEDDHDNAFNARLGWCPSCADFTTPDVALTDTRRVCVDCSDDGVSGVLHAKRAGFISVAA